MKSYYLASDETGDGINAGSAECFDAPMIVNCAGHFNTSFPFCTDNPSGRLDFYLMYITEGALTFTLDGGDQTVGRGNAIIFPPRTKYKYSYQQTDTPISYFWMHFTGSYVSELLSRISLDELCTPMSIGIDNHIIMHLQEMFNCFSENSGFLREELAPVAEQILLLIAIDRRKGTATRNLLSKSVEYIHGSFSSEISIESLARIENLSMSRYNTVFKEHFGIPPIKYIIKLRMANACRLLESTDMSIKQIGMLSGYDDPHFFSKQFKKYVGSSPLAYRQEKMR
jgi:AraC-like DNA-binding protein